MRQAELELAGLQDEVSLARRTGIDVGVDDVRNVGRRLGQDAALGVADLAAAEKPRAPPCASAPDATSLGNAPAVECTMTISVADSSQAWAMSMTPSKYRLGGVRIPTTH